MPTDLPVLSLPMVKAYLRLMQHGQIKTPWPLNTSTYVIAAVKKSTEKA